MLFITQKLAHTKEVFLQRHSEYCVRFEPHPGLEGLVIFLFTNILKMQMYCFLKPLVTFVFLAASHIHVAKELPAGGKLDKTTANGFISNAAQLVEASHETLECTKTLLRTRGIKI